VGRRSWGQIPEPSPFGFIVEKIYYICNDVPPTFVGGSIQGANSLDVFGFAVVLHI
jgi:hypothetical protein